MSFTESTALWCLVFALIGAHAYVFDRKIGVTVYAKIHKWTTPPGTPQGPPRGFVYNRNNQVRWFWATIIASVNAFIMIGWRHEDPRVEIMQFFLITPATWLGFLAGPLYLRFKEKRKEMFAALDEVQSGERDMGQEVREAANEKIGTLNRWIDGLAARFAVKKFARAKVAQQAAATPTAPPLDPREEERNAREALRKFTEGR